MKMNFNNILYDNSLSKPKKIDIDEIQMESYPGMESLKLDLQKSNITIKGNNIILVNSKGNECIYTIRYSSQSWAFGAINESELVFCIKKEDSDRFKIIKVKGSDIQKEKSWSLNEDQRKCRQIGTAKEINRIIMEEVEKKIGEDNK